MIYTPLYDPLLQGAGERLSLPELAIEAPSIVGVATFGSPTLSFEALPDPPYPPGARKPKPTEDEWLGRVARGADGRADPWYRR